MVHTANWVLDLGEILRDVSIPRISEQIEVILEYDNNDFLGIILSTLTLIFLME